MPVTHLHTHTDWRRCNSMQELLASANFFPTTPSLIPQPPSWETEPCKNLLPKGTAAKKDLLENLVGIQPVVCTRPKTAPRTAAAPPVPPRQIALFTFPQWLLINLCGRPDQPKRKRIKAYHRIGLYYQIGLAVQKRLRVQKNIAVTKEN